mgnify:CR=1 FL=1
MEIERDILPYMAFRPIIRHPRLIGSSLFMPMEDAMSQLDDTILDALTHVTFPKGFAQAEPAWVVTVDGVD